MDAKKKIILIDDHVIVRNGLKELIEKFGLYVITEQFNNGKDFLDAITSLSDPDLIIMDLNMPQMNGEEIMEILKEKNYSTPVLILTLNSDDNTIVKLFRLGVRGYLRKDCSADILKNALQSIFDHGYYHNEFLTLSLQHNGNNNKKTTQENILEQLTAREKEFLKLVCDEHEYTYEQIAGKMNVQHRTVDGYREAIFEKFGIRSKTGLVLFILKHQLFEHL
jgi:two-component system, NarL family, invasion response regulator UvrY